MPPLDERCGISTIGERIFLKFMGIPQIIGLQCKQDDKKVQIEELEMKESLALKSAEEVVLVMKAAREKIVLVTSFRVRVIS